MDIQTTSDAVAIAGGTIVNISRALWSLFHRGELKELARRKQELGRSSVLRPSDQALMRSLGKHQIVTSFTGGYASGIAPAVTQSMSSAGCEGYLGQILLNDPDDTARQICKRDMPGEYHGRLHETICPLFPGGTGGATVAHVKGLEEYYQHDVLRSTTGWLQGTDRDTDVLGVGPMLHAAFVSPGGTLAFADYPLRMFHEKHPTVPQYAITIWDRKAPVRRRFSDVQELLLEQDKELVRGVILTNNARDQRRNDVGIAQLLAAMTAGAWLSSAGAKLGALNGLNYIFPADEPGKTGTISVHGDTLPLRYIPPYRRRLPEVYYCGEAIVKQKIIAGIKQVVTNESLQGLEVEKSERGNVRGLFVIAPIEPESFQRIIPEVEERIEPFLLQTDPNICLQFASLGQPLRPGGTAILTFILLQTVAATQQELNDLATGKTQPAEKFLPAWQRLNGKKELAEAEQRRLLEEEHDRV